MSPFGDLWMVWSNLGIHQLCFDGDPQEPVDSVDSLRMDEEAGVMFETLLHRPLAKIEQLSLTGTPFQRQVWQQLLSIPVGTLTTYQKIAEAVGRPTAVRAVANAIGANPVAWLIPCHRVVRSDGQLGGYRWGVERKRAMLDWEQQKGRAAA